MKQPAHVEDVYPLSPLQQGILFHCLESPRQGLYCEQVAAELSAPALEDAGGAGVVDTRHLTRAWRHVTQRHGALRTAFLWRGLKEPVQVVHRQVHPLVRRIDLSRLTEVDREQQLELLRDADRREGFSFEKPPLFRLTIVDLDPRRSVLVWTFHHLLLDGWSIPRILAEVFAAYRALKAGAEVPEWPTPPPYKRYIGWLRKRDKAAAQQVWERLLSGFEQATPLPVEPVAAIEQSTSQAALGRGAAEQLRYRTHTSQLPARLAPALQARCRELGVTLGTLTQAIWALLLRRYSGRDDVLFGLVNSGRPPALPGVETMIGLFINTVPVRAQLGTGMSWREALRQLQADSAEWQPHSYVPLAEVQGWSDVPRGQPLFETLLVFENYPRNPGAAQGLGFDIQMRSQELTTSYPLTLAVLPQDDFSVFVVRDRQRFSETFAERLLGHVHTLLQAVAEPGVYQRPLSAFALLSPAERQQVLVEWTAGGAVSTASGEGLDTIDARFWSCARRQPDAIAVVDPGGVAEHWLSYAELARHAERRAAELESAGVRRDQPVVVPLHPERPHRAEMVVELLAVLRVGGAYLPIDPALPEQRQQWMQRDAEGEGRGLGSTPDSLAYLVYTSGSTGRPKGVAVPHRAVLRLLDQVAPALRPTSGSVYLQLAPVEFDASTFELWAPLTSGGRLVLYPGARPDLDLLHRVLEQQRVDTLWLTAGFFQQLMEERPTLLRGVRRLLTGGDVVPPGAVRRLWRACPGVEVINGYGPTENTTFTTFHRVSEADLRQAEHGRALTLGRPLAGTRVHVLSRDLRPLPISVPGELLAGGAGLARGYHRLPARTASSFVPDPFAVGIGGERLYRTGDLVRWRPDGRLDFLGRLDNQVKLRGFRVEPGEVEMVLSTHPAVETVAVVVAGQGASDKRLVAWVVPTSPSSRTSEQDEALRREILAHAGARLPKALLPAKLEFLDRLPLTERGKVDRRQLAAQALTSAGGVDRRAPSTATELQLAELWRELLSIEDVSAEDDFFQLGGHSLLAMRLIARLRQALKVDLPVATLFASPTLASLALAIDEQLADHERESLPPLEPLERPESGEAVFPLSFAQERLWFLARLEPNSPAYNIPLPLLLRGHLQPAAFAAAWRQLARRHEVLRTRFDEQEGRAVQRIADPSRPTRAWFDLTWVDLGGLDATSRRRQVVRLAIAETLRPFDLQAGPVARAVMLRGERSAEGELREHAMLLNLHHIAGDGWSLGILVRELVALYSAQVDEVPSKLPALPIQYADFAQWQREWLDGEVLQRQMEFWRERLADLPPLFELPTDRPRPAVQSLRGAALPVRFGAADSARLGQLAERHGVTPFMVILALFHLLLGRWADRRDPVVGSPVAGRRHPAVEGLIGFFVNTLVLRGDLGPTEEGGAPSFAELLRRARRQALDAYAHQDVPFEKLVDELRPERSRAYSPVFQVMLGLHNAPVEEAHLEDLELRPLVEAVGGGGARGVISKFDLSLMLGQSGADSLQGGRFHGELEYCVDLFDHTSMRRLRRQLFTMLDAVAADPQRPFDRLPLLDPAERHQLVHAWNDTAVDWPRSGEMPSATLPSVLAAQVVTMTDWPAVWLPQSGRALGDLDGEELLAEALSYGDLWRAVQELAGRLRGLGVDSESRVALSLDRGPEMLIVMLAVLTAGGAYVPVDPTFPAQRRAFMLQDSGARWLLIDDERHTEGLEVPAELEVVSVLELTDPASETLGSDTALPVIDPHQLAYVLYTSGSTGRPKGVQISHGSLLNFLLSMSRRPGLRPADLLLAVTTISFDIAGLELYLPLLCGAQVAVAPKAISTHGERLARLLMAAMDRLAEKGEEGRVALQATPATWRLLLDAIPKDVPATSADGSAPSLLALSGGEALPSRLAQRLLDHPLLAGAVELWNVYGPTETTIWSTRDHVNVRRDRLRTLATAPLGRPLANTDVHLLDAFLAPAPMGAWGDLYIGGDGLARGYHGRPALTAERLLPHPLAPEPGARLYATGDVARRRGDGDLEFRGRRDTQVKVRGFRIELGEIEAALQQLPKVARAVAHVHTTAAGGTQLVAYLVPVEGVEIGDTETPDTQFVSEEVMREHLLRRLPDYMVPTAVITLDALPLTPNGKLDRAALPAPEGGEQAYEAPSGEKEEALAAVWARVLRVDRVGATDSFFRLGGDSILTLQAIAQAREEGLYLEPGWFFQYPTLRELAARAESETEQGATASAGHSEVEDGQFEESEADDDFGWSDDDFGELSDAVDELLG